MNIKTYRLQTKRQLKEEGLQDVARSVDRILMKCLQLSKAELMLQEERVLTIEEQAKLALYIQQMREHVPLQYILEEQEFMKLPFYVNKHVLIPQPDTEILVETVIEQYQNTEVQILDIGTGSGVIAISLATYLPKAHITASDISKKALEVAKQNAKCLKVEERVRFYEADLWKGLPQEKWDVIVSNPPYIETNIIQNLALEVQKEPHLALDGGEDGLEFYRKILREAPACLQYSGKVFLEIGYNQKEAVEQIARKTGKYKKIQHKKDLEGNDRVIELSI